MSSRFKVEHKTNRQWVVTDRDDEFDDLICKSRDEAREKAKEMNTRGTPPTLAGTTGVERH